MLTQRTRGLTRVTLGPYLTILTRTIGPFSRPLTNIDRYVPEVLVILLAPNRLRLRTLLLYHLKPIFDPIVRIIHIALYLRRFVVLEFQLRQLVQCRVPPRLVATVGVPWTFLVLYAVVLEC